MVHGPHKPLFIVWVKNHTIIMNSKSNKNNHHIHCCQKCKVLSENWATQPGKWIKSYSDSDVEAFVWKNKMYISIVTFSGQRSCLTQLAWTCFYYLKPYFSITKRRLFHLGQISTNKWSSRGQQCYHYFSLGNKKEALHSFLCEAS